MDSQRIACFLELEETLSFTKAAENLFLSQSAVSRNIHALEAELQMELFERNSKKVVLTPSGQIMLDGIYELKERFDEVQKEAMLARKGLYGELRIGFLQEFILDSIPYAINAFELLYPNINVIISTAPPQLLTPKLKDGAIDFFVGGHDLNTANYPEIFICHRRIGLTVSADHPLANAQGPLSLKDFENDVFVTIPEEAAPARKNLLTRCAKCGFYPKTLTAPDVGTILNLIELGRCVSILYYNTAIAGNPHLRFIEMDDIGSTNAVIFWNEEQRNPCKQVFIDFMRNYRWPREK
ncbi:MAG: LysR family transcriptional regulator [Oscillospiraceae bacterium]